MNGSRLNKSVSAKWLSEVIEARYQEIFSLVKTELIKHDLKDQLSAGVIITGGASTMGGCIEMAEMILFTCDHCWSRYCALGGWLMSP